MRRCTGHGVHCVAVGMGCAPSGAVCRTWSAGSLVGNGADPVCAGGPRVCFFSTPLASWWSRRQEVEADEFAAAHADAGKLVAALVKLFRDNASTLTPDRIYSAFFDSHPPALVRIARLNAPEEPT